MKKGLTELIFVIDKSGSMAPLVDDTIGGFNGLIYDQKQTDDPGFVTTVLFSNHTQILHDHLDLREVGIMTTHDYKVEGSTALLDAVGTTIDKVQFRLDTTPEDQRPEHILFAIITDGQENASSHYTKAQVQKMIQHQTNGHSWQFIFLGANMDAVSEAGNIGISAAINYAATDLGTRAVYGTVTAAISDLKCARAITTDSLNAAYDASLSSL